MDQQPDEQQVRGNGQRQRQRSTTVRRWLIGPHRRRRLARGDDGRNGPAARQTKRPQRAGRRAMAIPPASTAASSTKPVAAAATAVVAATSALVTRRRSASAAPANPALIARAIRPGGIVRSGAVAILSPVISAAAIATAPPAPTGCANRRVPGISADSVPRRAAPATTASGVMPRWPATRPIRKERSMKDIP
ncbi:hypothetical protein WR25_02145 [Diploscapter pachys]|uniref:Uncharacterized protein n=1 Tax=Diploscapter pachys TaxID=2018661 RepID=A0A2A2M412_9BILA|nr:hypothetical protein WR25_02145 [Diploscapter pachys]